MTSNSSLSLTGSNSTNGDQSLVVICEDNPAVIQPTTGIDLTDPSEIFKLQAHSIAWVVAGVFSFIATVVALWLIFKHLRSFHTPNHQKHIIRVILLVPIYAIISWFSFRYYTKAVYYFVVRDCYEAFALYSFFHLVMNWMGNSYEEQADEFIKIASEHLKEEQSLKKNGKKYLLPWTKPADSIYQSFPTPFCCFGKYNPNSPAFLATLKLLVLQYLIIRPIVTIAACVLEAYGRFCFESLSPVYGKFWYTVFTITSVTTCMYALIIVYHTVHMHPNVVNRKPLFKFLAIKVIILLTLWQSFILSVLANKGYIQGTQFWTRTNIANAINSFLVCFEMLITSFLLCYAYSAKEYGSGEMPPTSVFRSLGAVLNLVDIWREMVGGARHIRAHAKGKSQTMTKLDLATPLEKLQPEGSDEMIVLRDNHQMQSTSTSLLLGSSTSQS